MSNPRSARSSTAATGAGSTTRDQRAGLAQRGDSRQPPPTPPPTTSTRRPAIGQLGTVGTHGPGIAPTLCRPAQRQPGQPADHEVRLVRRFGGEPERRTGRQLGQRRSPVRAGPAARRCRSGCRRRSRCARCRRGRCRTRPGRRTAPGRGWRRRTACRSARRAGTSGRPAPRSSSSTHRSNSCSGASQRISSSTAVRGVDLAAGRPAAHWPGCFSAARIPLPSVLTVASWPAFSSTITVQTISSSVSRSPESATCTSPLTRSLARSGPPVGDQRRGRSR